jgi:hypothetical protein
MLASSSAFCDLEAWTHDDATVQKVILTRVFEGLGPQSCDAVAIFVLRIFPWRGFEAAALLAQINGLDDQALASAIRERELRPAA